MFARMAAMSTLAPTGSTVAMPLDNAEDCSLVSKSTFASAGQVDPDVWARFPGPFAIDFIFHFPRVSHI